MTAASTPVARTRFRALGTTAELAVTDPERLAIAEHILRTELQAIDAACSRFRADSEISRLHRQAGTAVAISPLLAHLGRATSSAAIHVYEVVRPDRLHAAAARGRCRRPGI
jgi:thiamine biosynthesis lipoprotein